MPRSLHPEAGQAAGGALSMGVGQVLVALTGVASALVVPRLLGPGDYGQWIMYRSIILLLVALCVIGNLDVIACFYVPRKAENDTAGAGRVFKTVTVARFALSLAAAAVGVAMLLRSASPFAQPRQSLFLALSILVNSLFTSLNGLLCGERRMRAVAGLNLLQAAAIPLAVGGAFAFRGLGSLPAACWAADVTCLIAAVAVARPRRHWAPGWLSRADLKTILRFAMSVALAATVFTAFANLLPYLMSRRGYSAAAIGYFGLSARCGGAFYGGLLAVAHATLPTVAMILKRDGLPRAFLWQNLTTRIGALLLLGMLGNILLAGPAVMTLIWGPAYSRITPVLAGSLLAALMLWIGSQLIRMRLLAQRPGLYLLAAGVYALLLAGALHALPPDALGIGAVKACVIAAGGALLCAGLGVGRLHAAAGSLGRVLLPALTVGAAWHGRRWIATIPAALAGCALWTFLFAAVVVAAKALQAYEVRDIVSSLRGDRAAGRPEKRDRA